MAAVATPPRGYGLALFLARGMSAWMAAMRTVLRAQTNANQAAGTPAQPLGPIPGRAELTTVMAGLLLACVTEEVGDGHAEQSEQRASAATGVSVRAAILAAPGARPSREHRAPI
jgi:hypothetical protein